MSYAVYLLCLDRPIDGRRHQVGSCKEMRLGARLNEHQRGIGAPLTSEAHRAGVGFLLADLWYTETIEMERQLQAIPDNLLPCPWCLRQGPIVYFPAIPRAAAPENGYSPLEYPPRRPTVAR